MGEGCHTGGGLGETEKFELPLQSIAAHFTIRLGPRVINSAVWDVQIHENNPVFTLAGTSNGAYVSESTAFPAFSRSAIPLDDCVYSSNNETYGPARLQSKKSASRKHLPPSEHER